MSSRPLHFVDRLYSRLYCQPEDENARAGLLQHAGNFGYGSASGYSLGKDVVVAHRKV